MFCVTAVNLKTGWLVEIVVLMCYLPVEPNPPLPLSDEGSSYREGGGKEVVNS